ncbi:UNVERIFIED_CONTAM: hypothetical protein H355_006486 [Colinus virginianus]|nr:hypothetical protein H355_006486 [Colinus virginianus]
MLCRALLRRTAGHRQSSLLPLQHLLDGYRCSREDDHLSYGEIGMPVPPFGCCFSAAPNFEHILAVANEEGFVRLYDTEAQNTTKLISKDGFYRQVNQISGAHNVVDKQTPSKLKKKRQNLRGLAPVVDFQQSVTVVLLQDEHTLISAGAVDGVIKVWDLRKNYAAYRQDPVPLRSFCYPGTSTRKLGYSSLVLDSTGANLFANCTDDNIYMFNMTSLKTFPVAVFGGHQNSTFYIKSSISPDDQFLVSGSSDCNAYIWKVSEPSLPPWILVGHSQEVTSIAWCPSDFTKIATCSDDNTVRIWRLQRCPEEEKSVSNKAKLVGWVTQKKSEQRGAGKASVISCSAAQLLKFGCSQVKPFGLF